MDRANPPVGIHRNKDKPRFGGFKGILTTFLDPDFDANLHRATAHIFKLAVEADFRTDRHWCDEVHAFQRHCCATPATFSHCDLSGRLVHLIQQPSRVDISLRIGKPWMCDDSENQLPLGSWIGFVKYHVYSYYVTHRSVSDFRCGYLMSRKSGSPVNRRVRVPNAFFRSSGCAHSVT